MGKFQRLPATGIQPFRRVIFWSESTHIWRLSDQYSSIMSSINYTGKSPRGEAMNSTGDKIS